MKKILLTNFLVFVSLVAVSQSQPIDPAWINSDSIASNTNNADLKLVGRGTGLVEIEGAYTLPGADGSNGQAMVSNGAGAASFGTVGDGFFDKTGNWTGTLDGFEGADFAVDGTGGTQVRNNTQLDARYQPINARLTEISALTPSDGAFIVGDGANFVTESGATARASLGAGDVIGPGSSTDNSVARYDGATGKIVQNSTVTIDDSGNITTQGTGSTLIAAKRTGASPTTLIIGATTGETRIFSRDDATGAVPLHFQIGTTDRVTITAAGAVSTNGGSLTAGAITGTSVTISGATANTLSYFNGSKAQTSLANAEGFLFNNGSGTLSYDNSIDLTSQVSGNLPVTNLNSGTNASSSSFWRGDGTWAIPTGGDVTKVGTPADNQLAVWTGDGTLEGEPDITYNGTTLNLTGNFGATVITGNTVNAGSIAIDNPNNTIRQTAVDTDLILDTNGGEIKIETGLLEFEVGATDYFITTTPSTFEFSTAGASAGFQFTGADYLTILSNANFGLGGASFGTSAANVFAISNGTPPSTSISNGVQLYAEDEASSSELKVRDEAGNITPLSPHNFSMIPEGRSEEMAWSFYSERNGNYVNVDMMKAIRLIETQQQEIEELKALVYELAGKEHKKRPAVKLVYTGEK